MNIEQMASIGLRDDLSRTASISHNLANALTPGFKATRVLPAAFTLELSLNAADPASVLVPPGVPTTSINALPGSLRPTSVASDVASDFEDLGGDIFILNRHRARTPSRGAGQRQRCAADHSGCGNGFVLARGADERACRIDPQHRAVGGELRDDPSIGPDGVVPPRPCEPEHRHRQVALRVRAPDSAALPHAHVGRGSPILNTPRTDRSRPSLYA